MKIYFDNAATTPPDPEVCDEMIKVMKECFGNPSSTHSYGRQAKALIETSRKKIAGFFNASPGEIFFTSGGTEADNMAIRCSVNDLGIKHIITSRAEHHAILHTVEMLEKVGLVTVSYVHLNGSGHIEIMHLEELLQNAPGRTLVTLMHANNEIGNLLPIKEVGELCRKYNVIFHSDTVQTAGHYKLDLKDINVHFITCAAHKFHGPKGSGFLYIHPSIKINPLIYGGAQERNMRGGTENVYGIVGLAKALEIAYRDMEAHQQHILAIKSYMIEKLEKNIPGVEFNGDAKGNSLYTVLNVLFPHSDKGETLLFNLDISGIATSAGSACSSGSNQGSHVLRALGTDMTRPAIRFSFSKYNTKEEVDYCVAKLTTIFSPVTTT